MEVDIARNGDTLASEAHQDVVNIEMNSALVVTFFALSCFYFVVTIIGLQRLCQLEQSSGSTPKDPNILATLLCYLLTASCLRLLGWALCTSVFFNSGQTYIDQETYEQIWRLATEAKNNNVTLWLPLEPEYLNGVNESPLFLVLSIFAPEVFVLVTYLALCWLYFSSYIDAHEQALAEEQRRSDGYLKFRVIVSLLILLQILLVTIYMAGAFDAALILGELTLLELVSPITMILLVLYYQCKYSGVP